MFAALKEIDAAGYFNFQCSPTINTTALLTAPPPLLSVTDDLHIAMTVVMLAEGGFGPAVYSWKRADELYVLLLMLTCRRQLTGPMRINQQTVIFSTAIQLATWYDGLSAITGYMMQNVVPLPKPVRYMLEAVALGEDSWKQRGAEEAGVRPYATATMRYIACYLLRCSAQFVDASQPATHFDLNSERPDATAAARESDKPMLIEVGNSWVPRMEQEVRWLRLEISLQREASAETNQFAPQKAVGLPQLYAEAEDLLRQRLQTLAKRPMVMVRGDRRDIAGR